MPCVAGSSFVTGSSTTLCSSSPHVLVGPLLLRAITSARLFELGVIFVVPTEFAKFTRGRRVIKSFSMRDKPSEFTCTPRVCVRTRLTCTRMETGCGWCAPKSVSESGFRRVTYRVLLLLLNFYAEGKKTPMTTGRGPTIIDGGPIDLAIGFLRARPFSARYRHVHGTAQCGQLPREKRDKSRTCHARLPGTGRLVSDGISRPFSIAF